MLVMNYNESKNLGVVTPNHRIDAYGLLEITIQRRSRSTG